ncbi:hypothetical protein GCM10022409_16350 [Hymenobacter glaciei]|uniref:Carboxypeptidase-like regulatory domain-containing protein n=1 Tax=Hymenobacter glaciei TaxID=877209 RepID=A0ABP7TXU3_9BACT
MAQTTPSATPALAGQVLDQTTQAPVAYPSVGVLRRPLGTVADDQGRFALSLPAANDQDSLRIGLLGYAPLTVQVAAFRRQLAQSGGRVYLRPAPMQLAEVVVRPGKLTRRVVGNSANTNRIQGGFAMNTLGKQLAQGIHVRRPSTLEQVSFHVSRCTYDSLFYRINVYQVVDGVPTANLLPEPVYVRVRKGQLKDRMVADLRRFNISVQGDIAVGLEMVKNLGPGQLMLGLSMLRGPVYVARQSTAGWERIHGFGVSIDATVAEYRNN